MSPKQKPASSPLHSILIFADGASSGNPGPAGFGVIIALPNGEVHELGRGFPQATNNQMELEGAIEALRNIREISGPVALYTDSVYVIRGITQWIWGWRSRGWKTAEGKDVQNRDQWNALSALILERKTRFKDQGELSWHWVKGHRGIPGNERADEIAVSYSKRRHLTLYSGPLLQYPVALFDLPEDTSLPERDSQQKPAEKKAAYSYLSFVNGVLQRHPTWKECEARVKGRPGAKFKKAETPEHELKIVEDWGLPHERLPPRN
jgi:ribonuclease HI